MLVDGAGVRRRGWRLVMPLIALACALAAPASASAELFTVDSTGDAVDAAPGSGGCLTAGGKCTLRAAIEEANASLGESDEIVFDETVFDGKATATIELGSSLPTIVDRGRIFGRECSTAAGVTGPCVAVDGPSGAAALRVAGTEEVDVEGLAVTGAKTAISIEGSTFVRVRSSWFGVALDGSAAGNGTAVSVGPGSGQGRIGGEGPEAGNLFAHTDGTAVEVLGASRVRILGNEFGVGPDGSTRAENGKDIEIASTVGSEAFANSIGTRIEPSRAATPQCDGGCNLISGSASVGIDIGGDGGAKLPAVATTIAGNHIGLDAAGSGAVPNDVAGIEVGQAPQTVIGGQKAGEANRIVGGATAVLAGPGAPDLVVRGNLVGQGAGGGSLAPPEDGIAVDSEGLSSPALEATIVANEIEVDGGVGVRQLGFGARIADNAISGAETGIETSGPTENNGNLIEGNSVQGAEANAILVANDLNGIVGNEVFASAAAGIEVRGEAPFGVTGNLVGGDTAVEENAIVGSAGAAIEILNVEESANEVARNHGAANFGPFIDLVAVAPGSEPKGPNYGIAPPTITTATATGVGGSAEAGARVRVFRKASAAAGELESFLGATTADSEGKWQVSYGAALPAGTIVAATQTSEAGGTSELATASVAADAGGAGGGGAGGAGDKSAPATLIIKGPPRKSQRTTARFKFDSDELGTTFECSLDGKPFLPCKSPRKYTGLRPGNHVFRVRAIDAAGNADPTPAKKKFTVLGPR